MCLAVNTCGLYRYEDSAWNVFDPDDEVEEYEGHEFKLCFYNLHVESDGTIAGEAASFAAWIASTWEQWLPWLREAGATDVLMNRDFGPTLRRWRRGDDPRAP